MKILVSFQNLYFAIVYNICTVNFKIVTSNKHLKISPETKKLGHKFEKIKAK
jgi:hypothetical protein